MAEQSPTLFPIKPEEEKKLLVAAVDTAVVQHEIKIEPQNPQNSNSGSEIKSGQRPKTRAEPKHSCKGKLKAVPEQQTERKPTISYIHRSRKELTETTNVSTSLH